MIPKSIDTLAECPFFRYHTNQTIACEGLIPDSGIINSFTDLGMKKKQYQEFCCKGYQTCEVYMALQEMYDEDGDRE